MFLSAGALGASDQQVLPEPLSSSLFITTVSDLLFQAGTHTQTHIEADMAAEVRTGNLGSWSWVTWQVHVGIRLTRKPLAKAS